MRELRRQFGLATAALLLVTGLGCAQSDTRKPPLSEAALLKVVKSGLEDEVIVALIKARGIAFRADDEALGRLKEGGASNAILAAVKGAVLREPAKAEEAAKGGDGKAGAAAKGGDGKALATAEHPNGLTVEVFEVKPDANRPLLTIKWRYRNPTKGKIELIGESPPLAVIGGTPRSRFTGSVYFLAGGKDDETQYRHSIVHDTGGKLWCKQIGTDPVYVPAGGQYEFWAKFELPVRTTEKISLHLQDVGLIEDVPVQWGSRR